MSYPKFSYVDYSAYGYTLCRVVFAPDLPYYNLAQIERSYPTPYRVHFTATTGHRESFNTVKEAKDYIELMYNTGMVWPTIV